MGADDRPQVWRADGLGLHILMVALEPFVRLGKRRGDLIDLVT
jgi:hypothetical protein